MPTRRSSGPLYLQIARRIQDRIDAGQYAPDTRLPSENEFAAEFGANRLTVRQAVAELARAGAIEIRRGVGTFVRRPVLRHTVDVTVDPASARIDVGNRSAGLPPTALRGAEERVLALTAAPSTPADQLAAAQLDCTVEELTRIDALARIDRRPWVVSSYWTATELLGPAAAELADPGPSRDVTEAVTRAIGVELEVDWRGFSAIAADIADAERLDVPAGTPLLVREGVNCAPDGRPVLYLRRRAIGDGTTFVLHYRDGRAAPRGRE
ncbi:GntR family transcriptional regulator [Streptomyces sp. CBMA123]|uniref:GntR family transcriptional regulator n=1 Tax=Streptomyces sp. CBMA123 TaxID=1896313 RepID=UPI001661CE79|nr:GntR family transcriptional regulator [Streptomyces sp. CBMA123]MBD0691314.1 hypothetical protein [Streptomyces sp. CBMA123]